jgi:hypothetical protein
LEELKNHFDQLVQQKFEEIKAGSATYGEALKLIRDLSWGTRDPFKVMFFKEIENLLLDEINQLSIG